MITHEILKFRKDKEPRRETRSSKFNGVIGSEEHKRFIYDRSVSSNPFEHYDDVLYKGEIGNILDIYSFEQTVWDGFKPKYLEVWMYGTQDFQILHPSDIKKVKK